MSDNKKSQVAAEIIERPAQSWLQEQYIVYTMYAIHSRALISDDGLKPVNRRILWSLFKDGVGPNSDHLKAARAAANAVAYHPHGSSSIEDALARMAQGFSLRIPLIDPYGSVGKVTGDVAAAARYWECRLSKEAVELVKEVNDGAVELGKNFDGKLDEPNELPVRWPTNIINGTEGIAVGYASKMFSHNPDEVMEAARKILKNPNLTVDQLLKIMPGPDLPTGGELLEVDGVRQYYETGTGSFIIRGKYDIEQLAKGKVRIVFYELPYQVSPAQVMAKIRDLQGKGKFKEIANVKDLTDMKNGLKLIIETKSGTNHLSVINELFKTTPVEARFSVNNTVLNEGKPTVVNMLQLLTNFINFRKACTVRKASTRIEKINARLKQLEAILAALLDIDKAIKIIRNAESSEEAETKLMKAFKIDKDQSNYILNMQLRRLTKADAVSLQAEHDSLTAEKSEKELILTSEEKLVETIDKELLETKKVISDKRRTTISGLTSEEVKEATKELAQLARDSEKNLPCYIVRFANGKLMKADKELAYKPTLKKFTNSPIIEQFKAKTQDSIVVIGSDGIGRRIPLSYLTMNKAVSSTQMGIKLPKGVTIVGVSKNESMKSDVGLAIGTSKGLVKIAKTDYPVRDEFPVITLDEDDSIVNTRWIGRTLRGSFFNFITKEGNVLTFDANTIRVSGSKAGGVRGMKLKGDEDSIISFNWVENIKAPEAQIISQSNQTLKLTLLSEITPKGKGGVGVTLHGFKKGETCLTQAYAGNNVVAGLKDTYNSIILPPLTKRVARGADFGLPVIFGSREVNIY